MCSSQTASTEWQSTSARVRQQVVVSSGGCTTSVGISGGSTSVRAGSNVITVDGNGGNVTSAGGTVYCGSDGVTTVVGGNGTRVMTTMRSSGASVYVRTTWSWADSEARAAALDTRCISVEMP